MIRKIFRTGHSYCVTLDKKMMKEARIESLNSVWVELDKKGKRIIIRRRRDNEW